MCKGQLRGMERFSGFLVGMNLDPSKHVSTCNGMDQHTLLQLPPHIFLHPLRCWHFNITYLSIQCSWLCKFSCLMFQSFPSMLLFMQNGTFAVSKIFVGVFPSQNTFLVLLTLALLILSFFGPIFRPYTIGLMVHFFQTIIPTSISLIVACKFSIGKYFWSGP